MDTRPVQLTIGGQSFRVVSSADERELQRLADAVSAKVAELTPRGKPAPAQAVVLAAIALAHELEQERARRIAVEEKARDMLRRVLVRLDDALDTASDLAPPTSG
jgi:cell division protein ZapA